MKIIKKTTIVTIIVLFIVIMLNLLLIIHIGKPNTTSFQYTINRNVTLSKHLKEVLRNVESTTLNLANQVGKERILWTYVISIFATLLTVFGIYSTISRIFEKNDFEDYKDRMDKFELQNNGLIKKVNTEMKINRVKRECDAMNIDNNLKLFCGMYNSMKVINLHTFLMYIDEVCDEFKDIPIIDISILKFVVTNFLRATIKYSIKKKYSKAKQLKNPCVDRIRTKMIEHLGIANASIIFEFAEKNI